MTESDRALLLRYHEHGDLQAREQLIEQYMALVRSLARRYATAANVRRSGADRLDRADQGDRPLRPEPRRRADDLRDPEHHRRDQAALPRPGLGRAGATRPAGAERQALEARRAAHRAARPLAHGARAGEGSRCRRGRGARGARVGPRVHLALALGGRDREDGDEVDPLESLGEIEHEYEVSETGRCSSRASRCSTSASGAILHLRFFEGLTQSQIAQQIGISQMHVSRLIRRALEKIRHEISADELDPDRAA